MTLLLILAVPALWLYAAWIISRRGRLPDEEDIAPGPHSKPSEAFYTKRREYDRLVKKWRIERTRKGKYDE